MPLDWRKRRVSTILLRHSTDWGVSVSEKPVRELWLDALLLILSAVLLFVALVMVLPLMAGLYLSAEITGGTFQLLVVVAILGLAFIVNNQPRLGTRNALELDCNASELRLGFINRHGTFVRQQIIPLARIENTSVEFDTFGEPELNFMVNGEQIRISLANAKPERVNDIAAQFNEAASRARNTPRHITPLPLAL